MESGFHGVAFACGIQSGDLLVTGPSARVQIWSRLDATNEYAE
jgi:phosphodiesterase/alkaline phosphatase D-like protein